MSEWVSGLAFWQLGLVWVACSLVLGLIAGRIIQGNPISKVEARHD